MEEISKLKEKEFKDAFDLYDNDKDGNITIKELNLVLKCLCPDFISTEYEIFKDSDPNGIGKLNFDDFIELMSGKLRETDTEEEIINAFKVFDKSGNGLISGADLRHIMTTLGDKLSEEEVDEIIREAEINGDGYILYEEFVRSIMSK